MSEQPEWSPPTYVDRNLLAQVFKDPRTLQAFEDLQQLAITVTPLKVDAAQGAASGAQDTADTAEGKADAAQVTADDIGAAPLVVTMADSSVPGGWALTDSLGVTYDLTTPNEVAITVDALTILNDAPIDFTQDVTTTKDVKAVNVTATTKVTTVAASITGVATINEADVTTLKLAGTPANSTAVADKSLEIEIGGNTFYLLLSTTP